MTGLVVGLGIVIIGVVGLLNFFAHPDQRVGGEWWGELMTAGPTLITLGLVVIGAQLRARFVGGVMTRRSARWLRYVGYALLVPVVAAATFLSWRSW